MVLTASFKVRVWATLALIALLVTALVPASVTVAAPLPRRPR